MIDIKTPQQIEIMAAGGKILSETLWEVLDYVKPGVTETELDQLAEKCIRQRGGEPGFMKVPGYFHTICASTNDVVVHGIPTGYALQEGDIIGIDCGVYYKGFHTDMSETIMVKDKKSKIKNQKIEEFLKTGKHALEEAIQVASVGNHIGHISKVIQEIVEKKAGYSVTRSLIGHGVGKELHEAPEVPGFLVGSIKNTPELVEGMTIAIEVIYNMGSKDLAYADDKWTIKTHDGSLSGVFERTVAITKSGPRILTP